MQNREPVSPLKAEMSTGYTWPSTSNLTFLISDNLGTLALSPECQSARMSEIKNVRLDLDGSERFEM